MIRAVLIYSVLMVFLGLLLSCNGSGGKSAEEEERIPVEITPVVLGSVIQSLNYNGDIKAELEVRVFSKIADRIEKFFVDESDAVRRGDPIAQIAATTIEQGVRQAEAALIAARAQEANLAMEYERAERLMAEDAMSKQQYDAVKTQYESIRAQAEQAEAAVTSMKSQLADARISAPISGIIGKRYFEAGDMASPVEPLVSVVQMNRVKIEFNATEEDLGRLAVGQPSQVKVKAYPERVFEGKVAKISPVLDPATRMAQVEVLVENSGHRLKPGMYAEVDVTTGIIENVMVVPRYAAIESTTLKKIDGQDRVVKNYYVFIVDSSRAVQRELEISYINHKSLAVSGGIKVGESLVVSGQNNLRDGMVVTAILEEGD